MCVCYVVLLKCPRRVLGNLVIMMLMFGNLVIMTLTLKHVLNCINLMECMETDKIN